MKHWKQAVAAIIFIGATVLQGPVFAAVAETKGETITVTGHAELAVSPDIAYVTAGVITAGADVSAAKSENDAVMQRITDALQVQGIDKEHMRTSQFSVQPVFRQESNDTGVNPITGYRVQNTITVTVEDMAAIGGVIDAAFQAGANQFQSVRFALKQDGPFQDALLKSAIQDGQHKAQLIARTLGKELTGEVAVTDTGRAYPVAMDSNVRMMKAAGDGVNILAGQITASTDVNLVFGMR